MAWGIVAGAAVGLVGSVISSDAQRSAGNKAADAQTRAAQLGIDEQKRQFDAIQKLLSPYVTGGTAAFGAQGDLAGLNGADKQKAAIDAIQSSPAFTAALAQGNNSILANASATGGLRGGNTQAALGQFAPALLAQAINDQFGRLGGLSSIGENAAAMTGNSGMHTADAISQLLQSQGAAGAGAALSAGNANATLVNGLTGAIGTVLVGRNSYTSPGIFGGYSNPIGETGDYRGTTLPDSLRGGF